jgi:hypothetical protein
MRNFSREGIELDPTEIPGEAVEQAMENVSNRIIWPSLIAAALLGLFCATGLVILIVKFCNWVMT